MIEDLPWMRLSREVRRDEMAAVLTDIYAR
jgi:hypothetical protein